MQQTQTPRRREPLARAQPARLYALLAGGALALLGALGFFYDAGFGTGERLLGDDLAGILLVNGWRNLIYLASGLLALGFAARHPRASALALGAFYLALGVWGYAETEHGVGSILDALPLGDRDNLLHLLLGILGLLAGLAEGGLPLPRGSVRRRSPRSTRGGLERPGRPGDSGSRAARAGRRRSPAGPRGAGGDEPR